MKSRVHGSRDTHSGESVGVQVPTEHFTPMSADQHRREVAWLERAIAEASRSRTDTPVPRGGLWAPVTERRVRQSHDDGMRFLGLRLGAAQLLGVRGSWDGVRKRLECYSLAQVLDAIGRISAVLARALPVSDLQCQLLVGLFPDEPAKRILAAVKQHEAQYASEGFGKLRTSIFDELQLINATKIAVLALSPDAPDAPEQSLEALGEALLMVSDVMEDAPGSLGEVDIHTKDGWRAALQHLLVNGMFHHSQHDLHVLARCHELFLEDKPSLHASGSYLDLPALARAATGLEPSVLWAVLFALVGHTISVGQRPDQSGPIWRASYFTKNFGFTAEESEAFFKLVTVDVVEMKRLLSQFYSAADIKPFHMLPLAQFPLIAVDDKVFCPSRQLLLDSLTHGLYHRVLNAPGRTQGERHRFMTYVGDVFGDYVDRLLERTFGGSSALTRRYFGADELRNAVPGTKKERPKMCDGVVLYGDAVLLFEVKAKFFSLAARTGESYGEYEAKIDEIVVGAAKQIQDTISVIENGSLRELGIDPKHIKSYFPIVVSLERIPLRGAIYTYVTDQIAQAGALSDVDGKVRPIQLLEADDLEVIEAALTKGLDLRDRLQRKIGDERWIGETFINFAHAIEERRILEARNGYLDSVFETLAAQAKRFFKSRLLELPATEAPTPVKPSSTTT